LPAAVLAASQQPEPLHPRDGFALFTLFQALFPAARRLRCAREQHRPAYVFIAVHDCRRLRRAIVVE